MQPLQNRREALLTLSAGALATAGMMLPKPTRAAEAPRRIRVGQIGVGHAHASKLGVYRNSPDYEVVGIVEPNPELRRAAENQATYRDLPWLTIDQLLATPDLEAVLVETHVRDLLNVAEQCVAAGKHVHIDKPAGASLSQFARILDSAQRQNLVVQLGYMYRYNPGALLLREFLKNGWLGDIFEIDTVMSKTLDAPSRKEIAEFSGGMMFELACHVIDVVITLMGRPTSIITDLQHSSPIQDDLADNCLAMMTWPGVNGVIRSAAQEVDGGRRRHFVVCGTEGTFQIQSLDSPSALITLARDCGPYRKGTHPIALPKFPRYVGDAADMAKIIRGEKWSDFPYAHELLVQEVVLRASGMPVDS